jgi:BON domain
MAHDYEDMHNIEELEDAELRDLVREQLDEHPSLDIREISVLVANGHVTLSGRVGTDGERRIAEHLLTDVLGVTDFTNDLMIDPTHRAESPEASDEQIVDGAGNDAAVGDVEVPFSAEAEHLADELQDDLAGTTDYTRVMEDGMTWNPPDGPTPEGMRGTDAGPEELGERH